MSKHPVNQLPAGVKHCKSKCLVQEERPSMYAPATKMGPVDPMLRSGGIYDKTAKVSEDAPHSSGAFASFFGRR